MNLKITPFPIGARPSVPQPDLNIYNYLGEEGLRLLVSNHYDLLVESTIKHLFPPKGKSLDLAKKNSADFFVQRFGGPNYYDVNRGKPMLTKRHEPFAINYHAREVWLDCYRQLLPNLQMPQDLIISYWQFLDIFSIWMVNTHDANINLD